MSTTDLIGAWLAIVASCLLYAAFCDVSVRLIPNRLSLAVAALAVPLRLAAHDLGQGLLVAAVIFMILTGAWMLRLLGGGDVKLWTACSLLVPPKIASQGTFSLRVILLGGVVAVAYLVLRAVIRLRSRRNAANPAPPATITSGRAVFWLRRVWRVEQWRARRGGSIPYGVAIALSALITVWPSGHG
ncbi:A24 family peptidase [Acidiphilium sp.]|uniref:A24 family peptidase n=1 Tax=Acidiphilium sp. TaxID=527 RepID=UPI003D05AAAC